jgi:FecR protein
MNFMKRNQIILSCALVLALAGVTTLHSAEEGRKEGKATVRSVHGKVEYANNDTWLPVKPNMKFPAGVTIRTGADGVADISVNGTSSAIRLTNSTTLQIPAMSYVGSAREGDTTTMLNLVSGSVIGNVKKISANSRYEIMTPHGVAGIRGTDFMVEAIPTQDGKFLVTFNSITGVITVSAVINGVTVTHTLTTGTSWQIGETPKQMAAAIEQNYQAAILALIANVENNINNGNPGGGNRGGNGGGNNGNGNNGNGNNGNGGNGNGGNPTPPFNGGPPQGQPAS